MLNGNKYEVLAQRTENEFYIIYCDIGDNLSLTETKSPPTS